MDGANTRTIAARRDDGTGFAAIRGKLVNLGIRDYRPGDHVAGFAADGSIELVIIAGVGGGRRAWSLDDEPMHIIGLVVGDADGGAS
jgi:hypothetical protein